MPGLSGDVRLRLSVMMFLQYAFQGIWVIPLVTYLGKAGFADDQVGTAYATIAIGCIVAPFFVGMIAWVARFACFGFGDTGSMAFLLYTGLALHGVCFDFFFVTGQLYTDQKAPKEVQAIAQGLITLLTFGLGWFGGSKLSGWIIGQYVTERAMVDGVEKVLMHDWRSIWYYPLGMAAAVTILFVLLFHDKTVVGRDNAEELPEPPSETYQPVTPEGDVPA